MLALNEVEVGMRFQSTSPVFRGDDIEFPAELEFEVVKVDNYWVKLKCEEEGRYPFGIPPHRKEDDKDYFRFVDVNLDTLNRQFTRQ